MGGGWILEPVAVKWMTCFSRSWAAASKRQTSVWNGPLKTPRCWANQLLYIFMVTISAMQRFSNLIGTVIIDHLVWPHLSIELKRLIIKIERSLNPLKKKAFFKSSGRKKKKKKHRWLQYIIGLWSTFSCLHILFGICNILYWNKWMIYIYSRVQKSEIV